MRLNSRLIENAQLRVIAEWLDQASRWLEDEIQDNREQDLVKGVPNSEEEVIEILTFLRPELDRMVTGFRRATVMLMTMTAPLADAKTVPQPTGAAPRSRPHLRLVK